LISFEEIKVTKINTVKRHPEHIVNEVFFTGRSVWKKMKELKREGLSPEEMFDQMTESEKRVSTTLYGDCRKGDGRK